MLCIFMIRFIDIRNQGTGARFAFWSTVTDQFIEISGYQAWNSWAELEDMTDITHDLPRLKALCPEWVNDGCEDDLENF